jgi:polar amino acid transport system substrate-binding protein
VTAYVTSQVRSELAPTGKLRAGINYGNFLLVLKDGPDGAPRGLAPDLGREIGRRLGLAVEFVRFQQASRLTDSATENLWDIGFFGRDPQRAVDILFSPAYLEIPVTYLVPPNSPIRSISDVDREGVRIAVSDKSAYDLLLSRMLKHAILVRERGTAGPYRTFVKEKLDVLAGLKPGLVADSETLPGSRVLDGQVTSVQQSIGTPRTRGEAGASYLREFVEEAKRSGFIAGLIEAHGVRGVTVAPESPTD